MSDIRFNQWLHNSGTGGVSQVDGGHVGIGTTNPEIAVHSGNNKILNVGIVTASTFYGDGSNLSGIQVGGASSLSFNDNIGVYFGNSQDLKIHHDGNHSYIDDQGTGNLRLRSGTLEILNLAGNKTSAIFSSGSGQALNFNNSTKFQTTNTGTYTTGIGTFTDKIVVRGSQNSTLTNNQLIFDRAGTSYIDNSNDVGALSFRIGSSYTVGLFIESDGTVEIPSKLAHHGDTNTFMEFGADTINFDTAGSERLNISSTGQLRAGDESHSDRTGYRHQFSSTAGSGDVLSIQNPSNTDGQGIGLGFWARNTNNAAIEVAKIKAVAEETQANSTQKGSLRFLTNKEASLVESMRLTNSGNVTIYGRTHSNQGTSSGNVPLQIVGGGNNVVTMFLGNGNTAGNGVNDYSSDIRFNGAAVAWGDLSYYPTGDSNGGAFRFTGNGATVASQGNRSLGCSGVFINGTSQSQHLDDYEEGDYTPNVQTDNGVNCGMSAAQGYYVKVGKIVTVHLRLATNSHNSVNTTAQYKVSLPFTSQAQGDTQGTLMCSVWSIGSSNISWMGGQVHNNNAWTHLAYHNGNNNNTNHLQPNVANNQLSLRGTVVYRSDS